MAAPTTAARAARIDASRLGSESQELRRVMRANLARSRQQLDTAQIQTNQARARRAIPSASPWSGLEWCHEDEQLGRVLVPLD